MPAPKPSSNASPHSLPISPPTAALAPWRWKKLHRICQAEVRRLKASYTPATVKFYLSKYRDAIRAVEPDHLVLRPRKMRSGQRFSYLALEPEETRALNEAYHQRIHRNQSNRSRSGGLPRLQSR